MNIDLAKYLYRVCFILLLLFSARAYSSTADESLPIEYYLGAYELLGRGAGPAGAAYQGWARIFSDEDELYIFRCIEGRASESKITTHYVTADKIPALRTSFERGGIKFDATCNGASDFDNLPRLMCLTYPQIEADIEKPGLESYVPIVWPVAKDYFNCN